MAVFTAIATAVTTFAATTFTAASIGSFLLKTAFSIGVNLIGKALKGDSRGAAQAFKVEGKLRAGGVVPRSIPLGWHVTAGSLTYVNSWGTAGNTPNAYLTQVIWLADMPVTALAAVWVNGEKVTLLTGEEDADKGYPVSEYRVSGTDYLWVKFYDGTQAAADAFLKDTVATTERPWNATAIGYGCAYAIVTARLNRDLFTGFPEYRFELEGMPLYDPTQDTTAGGSGSQRWDDPATWGGDGDDFPAVQAYNLLRGISYGGEWLYGFQDIGAAQLPDADWIAAIAACRTATTWDDGAAPTYRSGGELQVNVPLQQVVEQLLAACSGKLSDSGGIFKLRVGAPGSADVSITDADIMITEPQEFVPFPGLADTVNGIESSYPEPSEGWQMRGAPALFDTDLEAEDGGRRLPARVDMPLVPYGEQVQALQKAALAEARRHRRHQMVMPPGYWKYEPGDIVSWTSARHGYTAKLFRLDAVVDLGGGRVGWEATEVDPADYGWTTATDYVAPTLGDLGRLKPAPGKGRFNSDDLDDASVIEAKIADAAITANKIADGVVAATKFASGIEPVSVVSSLPDPAGYTGPSIVYLTTDGKLYRYSGGAWTVEVPAADVTGEIVEAQLADAAVTGAKIADGVIAGAKFASGIEPVGIGASLPTAAGYTGPANFFNTADGKLYRYVSGAWTVEVDGADIAAASIVAGSIAAGAIGTTQLAAGSVLADKIGAGEIVASKLAVAGFENLVPDASHQDAASWSIGSGWTGPATSAQDWISVGYFEHDPATFTGYGPNLESAAFTVEAGKSYYCACQHAGTGSTTQRDIRFQIHWYDNSDVFDSASVAFTASTAGSFGLRKDEGTVTAPAAARYGRVVIDFDADTTDAPCRVGGITVRNRVGTVLIEDGAIVAEKIAAGEITSEKIGTGEIKADNIGANEIVAGKIATGAVAADQIAAGAVIAEKIGAGEVVASKLAITDISNHAPDPTMTDTGAWTLGTGWDTSFNAAVAWRSLGAFRYVYPGGSGNGADLDGQKFQVEPGQKYYASFQLWPAAGATTVRVRGLLSWFDASDSFISASVISDTAYTSAGLISYEATVTAPSNAVRGRVVMRPNLDDTDDNFHVGGVIVRRMTGSVLIEDGAITADKITVGSLDAISANLGTISVDTANIANAAITSLKLGDGEVIRDKLNDGSVSDQGATYEAGPFTTSSTSFVFASTVNTSLLGLDFMYPITVSYGADIKTSLAGISVEMALYYSAQTGGGGFGAWTFATGSGFLINDTTSYVTVGLTHTMPALFDDARFRLRYRIESAAQTATVKDIYIKPLVVRK